MSSKEEAGAWAQDALGPAHQTLTSQALASYRGTQATATWEAVRRFGHAVLALVAAGPPRPTAGAAQQLPLGSGG